MRWQEVGQIDKRCTPPQVRPACLLDKTCEVHGDESQLTARRIGRRSATTVRENKSLVHLVETGAKCLSKHSLMCLQFLFLSNTYKTWRHKGADKLTSTRKQRRRKHEVKKAPIQEGKDVEKDLNPKLWTDEEIRLFGKALKLHGNNWQLISKMVGTRNVASVRESKW